MRNFNKKKTMIWCTSSRPRPPSIGSSAHFLFPSFNAELRCFIKKKKLFVSLKLETERERKREREVPKTRLIPN